MRKFCKAKMRHYDCIFLSGQEKERREEEERKEEDEGEEGEEGEEMPANRPSPPPPRAIQVMLRGLFIKSYDHKL